jgi:hypothetical protein
MLKNVVFQADDFARKAALMEAERNAICQDVVAIAVLYAAALAAFLKYLFS